MEKCPKCKKIYLEHDPRYKAARCYNPDCDFWERVRDYDEFFERFVISELNWSNYCAQTPKFVREIRGTLSPKKASD